MPGCSWGRLDGTNKSNHEGETTTFAEHLFAVKAQIERMFAPNA
jgi:hypothetical protein